MEKVTADSPIILTVQQHPEIIEIFMQYGLGCVGCMAANFETIGQGATATGWTSMPSLQTSTTASLLLKETRNKKIERSDF